MINTIFIGNNNSIKDRKEVVVYHTGIYIIITYDQYNYSVKIVTCVIYNVVGSKMVIN